MRSLELNARVENTRELKQKPVKFELTKIKEHFDDGILSIENQYRVFDDLQNKGMELEGKTILRSQIVLAEGTLDFFIHEMSKYAVYHMFINQWSKSDKYDRFSVPMGIFEKIVQDQGSDDAFFEFLNERFSREVYLSEECMKDQLNLIGIKFSDVMEKAFPTASQKESIEQGRNVVKELFKRRNEIAHQIDRSHISAEQEDITKDFVYDNIGYIKSIANAIFDIALQNEQAEA